VFRFLGIRQKNEPLSPFFRTSKASAKGICLLLCTRHYSENFFTFRRNL
jgi:hypothetical protein